MEDTSERLLQVAEEAQSVRREKTQPQLAEAGSSDLLEWPTGGEVLWGDVSVRGKGAGS